MTLTITGGEDVNFEVGSGNTPVADLNETGGATVPPPGSPPGSLPVRMWSISGGADAARFGINASTGELYFNFVPDFLNPVDVGANNVYDVEVQVLDPFAPGGPESDTQSIHVTVVDPLLAAPQITTLGAGSTATVYVIEGNPFIADANITDATPGDSELWSLDNTPEFVIDPTNGVLLLANPPVYDPGGANSYQVEITVTDGTGRTDSQLITVNVLPGNSETQITSLGGGATASVNVAAGSTFVVNAEAIDLTPNDGLMWSLGSSAVFTIDEQTGVLSFIDPPVFIPGGNNSYEVDIMVLDTVTGSDMQTVTVNVVNDPPVSNSASITLDEDTATTGTLVATDPEGAALTYAIVTNPLNGTISNFNVATGAYTYTPNLNYNGPDSFTFRANDGTLDSNIATVALTVDAVNDAPVVTIVPTTPVRVGNEIFVNTTTLNAQNAPAITTLASGGFVVTWVDASLLGGDASSSSIKGQLYDAAGTRIGGEFLVNTQTANAQTSPAVAGLASSGFVVTWTDDSLLGGDASNSSIKGQRFDAAGNRAGGEFLVNTSTSSIQFDSTITALSSGGFVVSWTDNSRLGGDADNYSVKAQIYDAAGARVGAEFLVNTAIGGPQAEATITGLATGGFVVSWVDSHFNVKAQIFDAAGARVGSELTIKSGATLAYDEVAAPVVTSLASGGFVVSWVERDNFVGTNFLEIKARIYDANGIAVGAEVSVQSGTIEDGQFPVIASLLNGGFIVSWQRYDSSSFGIVAQSFDATGVRVGNQFIVNAEQFTSQTQPTIAARASGGFVASWYHGFNGGGDPGGGIRAQIYGPAGFSVIEQTAYSLKGSVSIADVDVGAGTLTATLAVDYGILTVTAGTSGASVTDSGTNSVTVTGTLSQINALLGSNATSTVSFTANTDAPPASAAFTVTVSDNGGTGADPGLTGSPANEVGTATVAIAITGVNDAPQGTTATVSMLEDGPRALSVADFGFSDVDANAFDGVIITTLPTAGTLSLNGVAVTVAGTIATGAQVAAGQLVYTPAANASGATYGSFTFQVRDTGGTTNGGVNTGATASTLTFNVAAVNDAPTIAALQFGIVDTAEPAGAGSSMPSVRIDGLVNAVVADVDNPNFNGGSIRFAITNGLVAAQDRLVIDTIAATTVTVAAGTGVVSVGGVAIGTATGGGAGGGDLLVALTANATAARVQTLIRAINFANTGGDNPTAGARTITTTLTDGSGTSNGGVDTISVTSSVRVADSNDAPSGTNGTVTLLEDGSRVLSQVDFGFSDVEGHGFAGVVITTLPTAGTLRLNGVPITVAATFVTEAQIAANELVYTPAVNGSGATYASFTFQVRDTGGTLNSGVNTDASANTLTFSVTPVDDAPTLTATGTNPVFAENGSPLDLFSSVTASAVDTGQTFTGLTMTVTNVTNAASERLTVDGATFTLQDGSGANPTTNGLNIRVSLIGTTATVSFSGASLTAAQLQTIIDQMTYQQFGDAPVDTNLVFTIAQLTDSGSFAAPNANTAALALTSTVNVNPVNDAPTLTGVPLNFQLTRNATLPLDYSSVAIADPDSIVTATILASAGGTLAAASGAGVTVGGSGATLTLTGMGAALTTYLDTVSNITYTPPIGFSGNGNAFSISVTDGVAPAVGNATQSVVVAPISLTTAGLTVSENFDSLATGGATNQLLLSGWSINESGGSTTNNELFGATAGTATTGDVYSFGFTGNTERALGSLASGTLGSTIGAVFINNTGATINALQIAYTGEQWRIGNISAGRAPDRLDFQLSTDATSLTNGAWTDYNSLDFSSPVTTGGAIGSLDGNAAGNRVSFNLPITNISIAPGATFWLRWVDFDAAGADDALAIDNFSIIAFTNTAPVVDLDTGAAGNDAAASYVENAAANAIASLASVTDADVGDQIVSAVVTLTNAQAGDAIGLSAALPTGITAVTTATTITLSGNASPANYENALRLITFASTSDNPTAVSATRNFTVTVNDGDSNSVTRTSVVTITPVNDAPSGTDTTITLVEDTPRLLTVADFGFGDIDGNAFSEVLITAATGGTVFFDADGTAGAGAPIAITGFPQSYAADDFIAGRVSFQANANLNGTGVATLVFMVRDNGGGANGGIDTDQSANTITFSVTAVDDAPVAVADPTNPVNENATVAIDVRGNDTDVDGGPMNVIAINGATATIGLAIALASGATATLNADGTITYNPNDQFNTLIDTATAAATGATNASATDNFTYALTGGSTATVTVRVNGVTSAGDQLQGAAGDSTLTGTAGVDTFNLTLGGNDTVNGGDGNDAFVFAAAFTAFDTVDGGLGNNDQVGLSGDYSGGLVLGANTLTNVEVLAMLPGNSYNITSNDGNVAAGQVLSVYGGGLLAGNNLTFNGSAETDGMFRMYGGLGNDSFIGGALDDGFYFGPGKWGAGDTVVGGGGANDQLALDGNYTIAIGANADVEALILFAGPVGTPNNFNLTLSDVWTAAAATKTVWGINVTTGMVIDGSTETNGNFIFFGGQASDTLTGGAGADAIYGGGGGDALRGNSGADVFRYDSVTDSNGLIDATRDRIQDFTSGTDKIDLSRIDAIAGGADNAFAFIGNAAFGNVAGQLRYADAGGGIFIVEGDVDGDGLADFTLSVTSVPLAPPVATDFVL